jgi:hypothetical protein
MSEKQQEILDALDGKSLTAAEVSEATGQDQVRCSAMLTYMKKKRLVDLVDKRWQLTGAAPAEKSEDDATPPRKSRATKPARPGKASGPAKKRDAAPVAEAYLARDGSWIVVDGMNVIARVPAAIGEAIRRA